MLYSSVRDLIELADIAFASNALIMRERDELLSIAARLGVQLWLDDDDNHRIDELLRLAIRRQRELGGVVKCG